jgi:hypothetical protein
MKAIKTTRTPLIVATIVVTAVFLPAAAHADPNPSTSAPASPTDYARMLIQAGDIDGPEVFTADPPEIDGNPQETVGTTFRNPDNSHTIYDSIWIAPDPAAATRAMQQREMMLDGVVHGFPEPIDIGTPGAKVDGPSPDGTKDVTLLLFTEGKAYVELEFDGPPKGPRMPEDFVTDVGRKQDTAIKNGLGG